MQGNLDSLGSRKPQTQRDPRDASSTGPASRSKLKDGGPTIKSATPKTAPGGGKIDATVTSPEVESLVPIRGDGKKAPRSAGQVDTMKFWQEYYRTHDETPEQLRETLRILNAAGKQKDVYAVLSGYLSRRKNQETWMYEAVAMAIEMNGGKPEDVKKYLGYAADLALKSHNPNDLVSVADKLYLKGWYERIGPLLDEAAAKVPHRAEPLLMSINLAQKTKDPARMSRAIQSLLSLGWPGSDEYFRLESRKQAETLAAALKDEGKTKEAEDLIASLPEAESRDLFIRLTWAGDAGYDLSVEEPLGATAGQEMPRTVFGGAILNDGNLSHPEETYVCPRAFDGEYRIKVLETYSDPDKPGRRLNLEVITHEGNPSEQKQVFPLDPTKLDKPITIKLTGGRRKTVLPFVNPLATYAPLFEAKEKRLKADKAKIEAGGKETKKEVTKTPKEPIKVDR